MRCKRRLTAANHRRNSHGDGAGDNLSRGNGKGIGYLRPASRHPPRNAHAVRHPSPGGPLTGQEDVSVPSPAGRRHVGCFHCCVPIPKRGEAQERDPARIFSFRIHGRKGGVRVDGRLMTTPKLIGIPPHVATLTSADELCNLGRLRRLTVWLCRNANKWLARAGETGAGVVVMVRHCSLAWSVDGVPFWTSPSPPHLELDFRCRPSSLCSGQRGRGRICVNGSTLCVLAFCA